MWMITNGFVSAKTVLKTSRNKPIFIRIRLWIKFFCVILSKYPRMPRVNGKLTKGLCRESVTKLDASVWKLT